MPSSSRELRAAKKKEDKIARALALAGKEYDIEDIPSSMTDFEPFFHNNLRCYHGSCSEAFTLGSFKNNMYRVCAEIWLRHESMMSTVPQDYEGGLAGGGIGNQQHHPPTPQQQQLLLNNITNHNNHHHHHHHNNHDDDCFNDNSISKNLYPPALECVRFDPGFPNFLLACCTELYLKGNPPQLESYVSGENKHRLVNLMFFGIKSKTFQGLIDNDPDTYMKRTRDVKTRLGLLKCLEKSIPCDCLLKFKSRIAKKAIDLEERCGNCGDVFSRDHLFLCSGCNFTSYCSHTCQKEDWPTHKEMCETLANDAE